MLRYFFLLVGCAVVNCLCAQEAGRTGARLDDRGWALHVMPFSYTNFLPRFRGGVQYRWSDWSVNVDVESGGTLTNSVAFLEDDNYRNYNFWGIRPEVRWHMLDEFRPFYAAVEVAHTEMRRRIDGRYNSADGRRIMVQDAVQERRRTGLTLKAGAQYVANHWFFIDGYTGMGAAVRNVSYSDASSSAEVVDPFLEDDEFEVFGRWKEGKQTVLELQFGLRMGVWLGRKRGAK